jgi:hypothetical protein
MSLTHGNSDTPEDKVDEATPRGEVGRPTDQIAQINMRGADTFTESLFTMRHLDDFVPGEHPLRVIRMMVNKALANMDELFAQMYAADIKGGRPSIAPEKLLRAMLIQVLYSVRSERQLMEQTQYNLLFRWFIGLAMDDGGLQPHATAQPGANPSAGADVKGKGAANRALRLKTCGFAA